MGPDYGSPLKVPEISGMGAVLAMLIEAGDPGGAGIEYTQPGRGAEGLFANLILQPLASQLAGSVLNESLAYPAGSSS